METVNINIEDLGNNHLELITMNKWAEQITQLIVTTYILFA